MRNYEILTVIEKNDCYLWAKEELLPPVASFCPWQPEVWPPFCCLSSLPFLPLQFAIAERGTGRDLHATNRMEIFSAGCCILSFWRLSSSTALLSSRASKTAWAYPTNSRNRQSWSLRLLLRQPLVPHPLLRCVSGSFSMHALDPGRIRGDATLRLNLLPKTTSISI